MYAFGELLKGFRERSGVTQEKFAILVAVSRNSINAWENGRYPPGSRETVLRLAEELQLRPDETDSLLRAANYPLEYGNDARGAGHSGRQQADQQSGWSAAVSVFGYLHLNDGLYNKWFELRGEQLVLGRQPDCDVVIPVEYELVSRVHAKIYRRQSDVYLEDLGSSNGTYLEGKHINGARKLRPGQHILLGDASPLPGVCILEFTGRAYSTRRAKATGSSYGTRN